MPPPTPAPTAAPARPQAPPPALPEPRAAAPQPPEPRRERAVHPPDAFPERERDPVERLLGWWLLAFFLLGVYGCVFVVLADRSAG